MSTIKTKDIHFLFRCVAREIVSYVGKHEKAAALCTGLFVIGAFVAGGEPPVRVLLDLSTSVGAGVAVGYMLRRFRRKDAPKM